MSVDQAPVTTTSTPGTRVEIDLLGPMEVPNDVWYGVHTMRALNSFQLTCRTTSDNPLLIKGIVLVKKASALANKELGTIPADVADDIIAACDQILNQGACLDQFPTDQLQGGAGTSVNMNANEVIANLALANRGVEKGRYDIINPNDHVNACQSTNDTYATGIRLAVYMRVRELCDAVDRLRTSLRNKGTEFARVIKMGRTQMQDAVPMTLGQEFNGYAALMDDETFRLERCIEELLSVNLGGTAIGSGINTPEGYKDTVIKYLKNVTGWRIESAPDLIAATSDAAVFVTVHAQAKRLAVRVSKICNDLRLLSSGPRAGLNEINLPEMQAGSSIMPAKVNPVIPEAVNQVCYKVIGNDVCITMAAEAAQLQLNVMEPVLIQCLHESLVWLTRAVDSLRDRCIDGITANVETCREQVMNSIGLVTYLNPIIGHHNGDLVGRECAATGKTVREVVLEKGLLTEEQVDEIFSIENLLHPRYQGPRY